MHKNTIFTQLFIICINFREPVQVKSSYREFHGLGKLNFSMVVQF